MTHSKSWTDMQEKEAIEVSALTNVSYDVCLRMVQEIDDVAVTAALMFLLSVSITSAELHKLYECVLEIEGLQS